MSGKSQTGPLYYYRCPNAVKSMFINSLFDKYPLKPLHNFALCVTRVLANSRTDHH